MPLFYRPECKKDVKIGIIPHIDELETVSKLVRDFKLPAKIIDLRSSEIEDIINNICNCEYILSLHFMGSLLRMYILFLLYSFSILIKEKDYSNTTIISRQ